METGTKLEEKKRCNKNKYTMLIENLQGRREERQKKKKGGGGGQRETEQRDGLGKLNTKLRYNHSRIIKEVFFFFNSNLI